MSAPEYPQFGNLTLCRGPERPHGVGGRIYRGTLPSSIFSTLPGEPRPCKLSINHKAAAGSKFWPSPPAGSCRKHLAWKSYGPFDLIPGRNLVQISTAGFMPHLRGVADFHRRSSLPRGPSLPTRPEGSSRRDALKSRIDPLRKAVGVSPGEDIQRKPILALQEYYERGSTPWKGSSEATASRTTRHARTSWPSN